MFKDDIFMSLVDGLCTNLNAEQDIKYSSYHGSSCMIDVKREQLEAETAKI